MIVTPPTHSTRIAGEVYSAELIDFKPKPSHAKKSVAQQLGLRYERRALVHLAAELEKPVVFHPAFRFRSEGKQFDQFAIPDALYISSSNVLTIFEIKLKHTADAWHQLKKLYLPIVAKAYPGYEINLCEICASYDRGVQIPKATIIDLLPAFAATPTDFFGVYLWSGRIT
jgi:hypothetical protein